MTVARSRITIMTMVAVLIAVLTVATPAAATESPEGEVDPTMCGVMSLDELNALSPLQYDTASVGFAACTYSSSSAEGEAHSVEVNFTPIGSLKELKTISPGGLESTVAGAPAYFFDEKLWMQVLENRTIAVVPVVGDGPGSDQVDLVAYASQIGEIVIPRLIERERAREAAAAIAAAAESAAANSQADGAAIAEATLCDAISREQLDSIGPLRYSDPFSSSPSACIYPASELQDGVHTMSFYLEEGLLDLDTIKLIYTDGQEVTIAGRDALLADGEVFVDIDGALLTISPRILDSPASEGLDADAYVLEAAGLVVAGLQVEE